MDNSARLPQVSTRDHLDKIANTQSVGQRGDRYAAPNEITRNNELFREVLVNELTEGQKF